jgi:hypothetical protein
VSVVAISISFDITVISGGISEKNFNIAPLGVICTLSNYLVLSESHISGVSPYISQCSISIVVSVQEISILALKEKSAFYLTGVPKI